MKQIIVTVLDFFYTPVQKWIDRQTFRYIACGGGNTLLDIVIYSITYNYCIDYLRLQKRLHYPDWNKTNVIPEIPDESEEDLSGATFENVMAILELVHPEEKALLLMKYQDQLSLKEIAQTLRVSEDAVKMRLKRARTRVYYLYRERYS